MKAENKERAQRARRALEAYAEINGMDADALVTDLLTDLRHYCELHGDDCGRFITALERSALHYEAERLPARRSK